jgi:hypothetical protein
MMPNTKDMSSEQWWTPEMWEIYLKPDSEGSEQRLEQAHAAAMFGMAPVSLRVIRQAVMNVTGGDLSGYLPVGRTPGFAHCLHDQKRNDAAAIGITGRALDGLVGLISKNDGTQDWHVSKPNLVEALHAGLDVYDPNGMRIYRKADVTAQAAPDGQTSRKGGSFLDSECEARVASVSAYVPPAFPRVNRKCAGMPPGGHWQFDPAFDPKDIPYTRTVAYCARCPNCKREMESKDDGEEYQDEKCDVCDSDVGADYYECAYAHQEEDGQENEDAACCTLCEVCAVDCGASPDEDLARDVMYGAAAAGPSDPDENSATASPGILPGMVINYCFGGQKWAYFLVVDRDVRAVNSGPASWRCVHHSGAQIHAALLPEDRGQEAQHNHYVVETTTGTCAAAVTHCAL